MEKWMDMECYRIKTFQFMKETSERTLKMALGLLYMKTETTIWASGRTDKCTAKEST